MKKYFPSLLVALVIACLGAGGYYWWQQRKPPAVAAVVAVPAPVAIAPAEAVPVPAIPSPVPTEPAIQYPLDPIDAPVAAPVPALPALSEADPFVSKELYALLARKDVLTFLALDGFVRHVVATVDNLGRAHAPQTVWPVSATPGRFTVQKNPGNDAMEIISAENALRYTPFVMFADGINTKQAVALYVRLYPLFQQAYQELGFPERYFNDRLVAVIDQLLLTPVQTGEVGVKLVQVKGPIPSLRPWVRYEFTDPALESLSAGQKMLLRMGPAHHQRISAKLLEIRKEIVATSLARSKKTTP
jgi:hypothetical protein